jgi:methyl-accepting chemotaxis protein
MAQKRLSISLQFSLLLTLVLVLNGGAFYFMLQNVYKQELRAQAQTVVANVEAFGTWVAKNGRVWVKDSPNSFLGELEAQTIGNPNETHHFYSKNPALAQREFSETVAASSSPAKFRMTSSNVMNPENEPDAFEARALRAITNENLTEYYDTTGTNYRYAKTIYHKESCISCHGDAKSAPSDVITRYGSENGFGFNVGDVAGIISVTIPQRSLLTGAVSVFGLLELIAIFVSIGIILWFIRRNIILPVSRLTEVAEKISRGEEAELDTSTLSSESKNEIDQLTLATSRMSKSFSLSMRKTTEARTAAKQAIRVAKALKAKYESDNS